MDERLNKFLEVYRSYTSHEDERCLLNIYYTYTADAFDAKSKCITESFPTDTYPKIAELIRGEVVPPSPRTKMLRQILANEADKVEKLIKYGILGSDDTRNYNVGKSNYSSHLLQPWALWLDYPELTSFDHDIIKRILRTKKQYGITENESRMEDYQKIIHICNERIRQLKIEEQEKVEKDE